MPANEIVGLLPGEVFVHRNVANVVVHTDLNCLSVIQFAVDVLKVKHIMVVRPLRLRRRAARCCAASGSVWPTTGCGTCRTCGRSTTSCLCRLPDDTARSARLCELNVIEQVANVCQTTIVRDAWERGQELTVHGWIYGLRDGLLRDLKCSASSAEEAATNYKSGGRGAVEVE